MHKWKNHFYEMKGDVGISRHKKGNKHQDRKSFITTRREIGSETTDNLSEDNPVKNAYRASTHALILTHPYIFVSLHTFYMHLEVLFSLSNPFITNNIFISKTKM